LKASVARDLLKAHGILTSDGIRVELQNPNFQNNESITLFQSVYSRLAGLPAEGRLAEIFRFVELTAPANVRVSPPRLSCAAGVAETVKEREIRPGLGVK
jgi:hypothetical protein